MLYGSPSEITLVQNLKEFKGNSYHTLRYVLEGMTLARDIIKSKEEKENLSHIIDKISAVDEIISSFNLSIKDTTEPNKLYLNWNKTGTSSQFSYSEEDLTEKLLCYILMTFEKEVSQRLSIIEESNKGYIYFCEQIKNSLHKVIANYMVA